MLRRLINFFKIAIILAGMLGGLVLGLNFWVILTTSDSIYADMDKVPTKRVALLLGTSKSTVRGGTNKYFAERINAAAELYHRGVFEHIIVSGDNETIYYNEPKDMYQALVDLGVGKADITLDFAGFRTLDSVVRAKLVFGQNELVIITQDFHCYRALFIANHYDINAVAFSADNKDRLPFSLAVREVLARTKAVLDLYIFDESPRFLGEKETLTKD